MHVRFSTCAGMVVLEQSGGETVGYLGDPLIHPDTGKLEGFFVEVPKFLGNDRLFLSTLDIVHWGTYVRISDRDVLSPLEERVRLQQVIESGRTFFGQRMITESGRFLGRCRDIQFDTRLFQVEWLFPRKWFRWSTAVPITEVLDVRREAIVVRDPAIAVAEPPSEGSILKSLEDLADAPSIPTPGGAPVTSAAHRRQRR